MTIEKEVRILYEQSGAEEAGQTLDDFDDALKRLGTTGKRAFGAIGDSGEDAAEAIEEINDELDELQKQTAFDKLRASSDEFVKATRDAERATRQLDRALADAADPAEDLADALSELRRSNALEKQLAGSKEYRDLLKETTKVQRELELAAMGPGARALAFVEGSDNVRGFIEVAAIARDQIIALYGAIKQGAALRDLSANLQRINADIGALQEAAGGVITDAQAARVATQAARLGATQAQQEADLKIASAIAAQQVLEQEGTDFRQALVDTTKDLQDAFSKGEIPESIKLLDRQGTLQRSVNQALEAAARARGVTVDTLNAATRAEIVRNESLAAAASGPSLSSLSAVSGVEANLESIFNNVQSGMVGGLSSLSASTADTLSQTRAELEAAQTGLAETSKRLDEAWRVLAEATTTNAIGATFEGTTFLIRDLKNTVDSLTFEEAAFGDSVEALTARLEVESARFNETARQELFTLIDTGTLAVDKIDDLSAALQSSDIDALRSLIGDARADALLQIVSPEDVKAAQVLVEAGWDLTKVAAETTLNLVDDDDVEKMKLIQALNEKGFASLKEQLAGQRARVDLDKSRIELLTRQERVELARAGAELSINEQILAQVVSLEEYEAKSDDVRINTLKTVAAQKAGLDVLVEGSALLSKQDAEAAAIRQTFSGIALAAQNAGGSFKEINKQAAQGLINEALKKGETDAILFTAALQQADKAASALGVNLLGSLGTGGALDTVLGAFMRVDAKPTNKKTTGGGSAQKVDLTAFKKSLEQELLIGRLNIAGSGERLRKEVEASLPELADQLRMTFGDFEFEAPINIDLEAATAFAELQAKFEDQMRQAGNDTEAIELVVSRFQQRFEEINNELTTRLFAEGLEGALAWGDGVATGFEEGADRALDRLAASRAEMERQAQLALRLDDLRFEFAIETGTIDDAFGERLFSDIEREFLRSSRELETRRDEELERYRDNKLAQLEIERFFNEEVLRLDRELKAQQAEEQRVFFETQSASFAQARSDIDALLSEFETDGPVNSIGQEWLNASQNILAGTQTITGAFDAFIAQQEAAIAAGKTSGQAISAGVQGALGAVAATTAGLIKDGKARAAFLSAFEAAQAIAAAASLNAIGAVKHTAAAIAFGAIAGGGAGNVSSSASSSSTASSPARSSNQRTSLSTASTAPFDRRFGAPSNVTMVFSSALDNRPPGDLIAEGLNAASAEGRGLALDSNLFQQNNFVSGL